MLMDEQARVVERINRDGGEMERKYWERRADELEKEN